jgi:hypothetical protein
MGYPACCVRAFARQADRSNNTLNRYLAAARTPAGGAWHWQLNELHFKLIPFYPCSYGCEAARRFADATIDAIEDTHPGARARIEAALCRTVLYFIHDQQLWLGADAASHRVVGDDPALGRLAVAMGDATQIELTDTALLAEPGGVAIARADPRLGFVAPFRR